MNQCTRFSTLMLLLSIATTLLYSPAFASTDASSSSSIVTALSSMEDDSASITDDSSMDDSLSSDSGSYDCTASQMDAIDQMLATNTQIKTCESKLGVNSISDLTNGTQLCECHSVLEIFKSLPDCTYHGYALKDIADALHCSDSSTSGSSNSSISASSAAKKSGFVFAIVSLVLVVLGITA